MDVNSHKSNTRVKASVNNNTGSRANKATRITRINRRTVSGRVQMAWTALVVVASAILAIEHIREQNHISSQQREPLSIDHSRTFENSDLGHQTLPTRWSQRLTEGPINN